MQLESITAQSDLLGNNIICGAFAVTSLSWCCGRTVLMLSPVQSRSLFCDLYSDLVASIVTEKTQKDIVIVFSLLDVIEEWIIKRIIERKLASCYF